MGVTELVDGASDTVVVLAVKAELEIVEEDGVTVVSVGSSTLMPIVIV